MKRFANLYIVNRYNAESCGIRSPLGDLTLAFVDIHDITTNELVDVLNYKSWVFNSWKSAPEKKYFVFKWSGNVNGSVVVYCSIGFSSILIRYLQNTLEYIINGKELFDAKNIDWISSLNMKYELWDFQKDAINSWIDAGRYGIIKASTGAGKSLIGCHLIKRLNLRTIICVHTGDLLINVWYNYLIEQFGESIKNKIGIIGGGLSKIDRKSMNITAGDFCRNIKQDIVIATSQSLLNHLPELGEERFGFLVIDEIQHYSSKQFRKIASSIRSPYRLALSATINRSDGTAPLFMGLMGPVRYATSIKDLAAKGLLVEPVFYQYIIDDPWTVKKIDKLYRGLPRNKKVVNNDFEMLKLAMIVKKTSASSEIKFKFVCRLCLDIVDKRGGRFILYTDYVNESDSDEDEDEDSGVYISSDYVDELSRSIKVSGISAKMSSIERQVEFEKLATGQVNGIIFGQLGSEGINIRNVDHIVMANATGSNIRFAQRCGRGLRKYPGKYRCNIYEILLNTRKELQWSRDNFDEFSGEGFTKEKVFVNGS